MHNAIPGAAIGGMFILFWIAVIISFTVLGIISLIDILKSDFRGNDKMIWLIVLLGTGPLGIILYMAIGKKKKI